MFTFNATIFVLSHLFCCNIELRSKYLKNSGRWEGFFFRFFRPHRGGPDNLFASVILPRFHPLILFRISAFHLRAIHLRPPSKSYPLPLLTLLRPKGGETTETVRIWLKVSPQNSARPFQGIPSLCEGQTRIEGQSKLQFCLMVNEPMSDLSEIKAIWGWNFLSHDSAGLLARNCYETKSETRRRGPLLASEERERCLGSPRPSMTQCSDSSAFRIFVFSSGFYYGEEIVK